MKDLSGMGAGLMDTDMWGLAKGLGRWNVPPLIPKPVIHKVYEP